MLPEFQSEWSLVLVEWSERITVSLKKQKGFCLRTEVMMFFKTDKDSVVLRLCLLKFTPQRSLQVMVLTTKMFFVSVVSK